MYTKETNLVTDDHAIVISKDENAIAIVVSELEKDDKRSTGDHIHIKPSNSVEIILNNEEIEEFIEALQLFKPKGEKKNHEQIGFHSK